MIRWFADLPVERKLRAVIMITAMATFAIATLMQAATNVLQEFLIRKLTPKVSNRDPGNGSKVTGPMAME